LHQLSAAWEENAQNANIFQLCEFYHKQPKQANQTLKEKKHQYPLSNQDSQLLYDPKRNRSSNPSD